MFLLAAVLAPAQESAVFAGFYKLGEPVEVDQNLRLTITTRIGNYGGLSISGGIILLVDPNLPGMILGIFPGKLDAGSGEMKRFEGEFTVPRLLYAEWQKGQTPCIRVSYVNSEGQEILAPIVLSPKWIEEER